MVTPRINAMKPDDSYWKINPFMNNTIALLVFGGMYVWGMQHRMARPRKA